MRCCLPNLKHGQCSFRKRSLGPSSRPRAQGSDNHTAKYKQLFAELCALDENQLRKEVTDRQAEVLDSNFLFWLTEQERASKGLAKKECNRLGGELVYLKLWLEQQSHRHLLSSLASSLAYANYEEWRIKSGNDADELAPGVSVERLLKLSEKEERLLQDQVKDREQLPKPYSTLDGFAERNSMYKEMASAAMARMRSRLLGYDDSSEAAVCVLDALLQLMPSREERATFLPEACTPPGLELPQAANVQARQHNDKQPQFVCTTPQQLLQAVQERQARLASGQLLAELPSGESLSKALAALEEDIIEYGRVYDQQSNWDKYGS